MRRNIDRRSTASDEEPLDDLSFRQLSNCSDQRKRHSIVAESIMSCESEVSTTSTFICSNQSEVSHVPVATATATSLATANKCSGGGAAQTTTINSAASIDRNKDLGTTRTPNESDEDNAGQKSNKQQQQRRHAINITSNPGYQVSGKLLWSISQIVYEFLPATLGSHFLMSPSCSTGNP